MRFWLFLAGLLACQMTASAQLWVVDVNHSDYKDGSTVVTAVNNGFVPCTVFLTAKLQNMSSSVELPAKIVVFPSKKTMVIAQFSPIGDVPHKYRYETHLQLGICNGRKPDTTYAYQLPFASGVNSTVLYAARRDSVRSQYLPIRFALPLGTPIRAAREGIVASIEQGFDKSVGRFHREDFNFIVILHDDGTYARYWHLQHNSATVRMGQRVASGDVIALAGQTGWAKEPCLGFAVSYPADPEPIDVPVLFQQNGQSPAYVKTSQHISNP